MPEATIPTTIGAANATLAYIQDINQTRRIIATEGKQNATDSVVRAAATFQLLKEYISSIPVASIREPASRTLSTSKSEMNRVISTIRSYYEAQLNAANTTALERAKIKREQAQLASLIGNEKRAKALRAESRQAYNTYTRLVENANKNRTLARTELSRMYNTMFIVVADQPLLLNPYDWSAFNRGAERILTRYQRSIDLFSEAGVPVQAQTTRQEMNRVASDFQMARYSLYISSAIYLIVFLGILVYLGRNTYAYIRDARDAVSGDFLVST
ncbi:MAG: hypothetical protein ABEI52_04190 [Halobacteriaceae archaeon]